MNMAFNYSDLQQKLDRYFYNSAVAIDKWIEFIADPAKDVTVEYYDSSGNLKTVNFPNRAKLVNDFIANINSVMRKTLYVDQENGDDGNDGSQKAPFKTLQKAINSIPPGGSGTIVINGTYKIGEELIVIDEQRYVAFTSADRTSEDALALITNVDDANGAGYIRISKNSTLRFWSIKLKLTRRNVPDNYAYHWTMPIKVIHGHNTVIFGWNCAGIHFEADYPIVNAEHTAADILFHFSTSFNCAVDTGTFSTLSTISGGKLISLFSYNQVRLNVIGPQNLVDENGNPVDWSQIIEGLLRDSDGKPRNIITNLVV